MVDVEISSYNIHSCVGADGLYSIDRVARVIGEGNAQIVCLQEVEANVPVIISRVTSPPPMIPIRTRIWSSPHNDDQTAAIASQVGFKYHAFAPAIRSRASSRCKEMHEFASNLDVSGEFDDEVWRKKCAADYEEEQYDINNTMGRFGIAILSKYPIVQIRTHQYQRYKRKTIRNAIACLVSLPNNELLWVVNTHLGCHFIGKEQNEQAKELIAFVGSLGGKSQTTCGVILCGDFNSPPVLSSIRTIRQSGMRDVWHQSFANKKGSLQIGGTFPSNARVLGMPSCFRKWIRLDYIFLLEKSGKEIVCKCVHVQDDSYLCSLASDHLPVHAVFLVGSL